MTRKVEVIDRKDVDIIIGVIFTYIEERENYKNFESPSSPVAPVVVALVNKFGAEPRQHIMDGALPVSSNSLALRRARTAATTGKKGTEWTSEDPPLNDGAQRSRLGGGAPLIINKDTKEEEIVGGIGVSGRKPKKVLNHSQEPRQDQELADLGADAFQELLKMDAESVKTKPNKAIVLKILDKMSGQYPFPSC